MNQSQSCLQNSPGYTGSVKNQAGIGWNRLKQAYSSLCHCNPLHSHLVLPSLAYSSLLQPIPVFSSISSLFQLIPTNSSILQHIPAYSSLYQPVLAYSSLFPNIQSPIPNSESPIYNLKCPIVHFFPNWSFCLLVLQQMKQYGSVKTQQRTLLWQHQEIHMVRKAILEELNFNIILFSN